LANEGKPQEVAIWSAVAREAVRWNWKTDRLVDQGSFCKIFLSSSKKAMWRT
jgi:hypothetical protein